MSWVGPPSFPLLTRRCSLLHLRTLAWDPTSTLEQVEQKETLDLEAGVEC